MTGAFAAAAYNVGDGPDIVKVKHLERLSDHRYGCTIAGCCECSDRRKALKRFRKRNPSWRCYQPRLVPGGSALATLWDNDEWERLHTRSVRAVRRKRVGPRGAGPTVVKTKRVNIVNLRHRRTGHHITVLETHMLPSVEREHLSPAEKDAREAHYREHIAAIVEILDHIDGPVLLIADLNANPDNPLLKPLKDAGLLGWTQSPTHDRATYDYVLHRDLQLLDEEIVSGGSDHDTVVHDLAFLTKETR